MTGDVEGWGAAARAAMTADPSLVAAIREELDALPAVGPAGAAALVIRADCALRLGEPDSAARDLNEALSIDPDVAPEALEVARALASRQPGRPLVALSLARALERVGDASAAAMALDVALAGEGAGELPLLLTRRRLAIAAGEGARAAELLAEAERTAPNRDRLLALLHEEAMARRRAAVSMTTPAEAAIQAGDYARAAALLAEEPPSTRKAWVLERCGRLAEAAACLEELGTADAEARGSALHDRVMSRALMGREPVLMAEAPLPVMEERRSAPVKRAAQARQAAQGGAS